VYRQVAGVLTQVEDTLMAITFNTNLSALNAQRNIGTASSAASSSLSKISSGSRVPQAKDDAAALAIGTKLKAEVSGLTQASNNAGQAVSLLQIADGALSTTADILTRMKTLAVQASSGQLADSDRALLQQEFVNLQDEVDRIANVTNFNGQSLLNGGDKVATSTQIQAGYLEGKGITASFDANKASGTNVFRVSYDYNAPTNTNGIDETATAKLTVTNMTTGASQTVDIAAQMIAQGAYSTDTTGEGANGDVALTALAAGKSIDVNFDSLGVTLKLDNNFAAATDLNAAAPITSTGNLTSAGTTVTFMDSGDLTVGQLAAITGFSATTGSFSITVDDSTANSVVFDSGAAANDGILFSLDGTNWTTDTGAGSSITATTTNAATTPVVVYMKAEGAADAFAKVTINAANTVGAAGHTIVVGGLANGVLSETQTTGATKSFDFKVGTGTTNDDSIGFSLSSATTGALAISKTSVSISTAANADAAIDAVGAAITTVSSRRADIGAAESRLAFAQSSISVAIENTTSAQSSLMDVDVSSEITKFTNQNVLMQAGISLLGQANQQPAMLLKLLQ
jgi:flagellin